LAEIIVRTATGNENNKANEKRPGLGMGSFRQRRQRPFYGWFVVAAAAVGMLLGAAPIVAFSFGVFLKPLTQEFHAGRAAVSLAVTILNFSSGIVSSLVGFLCDRIGARRVAVSGMMLLALSLVSARIIGARLWELYVFYAVVGAITPATTAVPYSMVVSRWFNRRRGLALGLMMLGLGIGAVVMPPLFQHLIARFGWRSAYVLAGVVVLLLPTPIVKLFVKESPQDIGLLPDGSLQVHTGETPANEGRTWSEIYRTGTFWVLVGSCALFAASVAGCMAHIPAMFSDWGADAKTAALAGSVVGLGVLVGRVGCGYFLDRYFGPYMAALVAVLAACGIGLLWIGSRDVAVAGALLLGLGFGCEVDIMAYLITRYFGLRSFGVAFGFGFGLFVLAAGIGPTLMGMGFDYTRSYRAPLAAFSVATLIAAFLICHLGPFRYDADRRSQQSSATPTEPRP
jgi:MFS family permease